MYSEFTTLNTFIDKQKQSLWNLYTLISDVQCNPIEQQKYLVLEAELIGPERCMRISASGFADGNCRIFEPYRYLEGYNSTPDVFDLKLTPKVYKSIFGNLRNHRESCIKSDQKIKDDELHFVETNIGDYLLVGLPHLDTLLNNKHVNILLHTNNLYEYVRVICNTHIRNYRHARYFKEYGKHDAISYLFDYMLRIFPYKAFSELFHPWTYRQYSLPLILIEL